MALVWVCHLWTVLRRPCRWQKCKQTAKNDTYYRVLWRHHLLITQLNLPKKYPHNFGQNVIFYPLVSYYNFWPNLFLFIGYKIIFCTFYLSGLGSIVYDVCCPCLSQYTALVPIGCHFSFSWNDIFLSVPFVLRYLPENCQCWLATHCKYTISYSKVQINVQECIL